ITFGSPSGNPQQIANTSAVTFPAATPSGWGTLTHFGIFDASTGGNLLAWNPLTASKTIAAGDNPNFPIGAITVSEN
ncbi:MAG TPA: hypothetical protein VHH73_16140, partial [Verrucomicrobiae bacterium]|nr:hypothetical protein [Verrucomicrobiae bacterium]